MLSWEPFLSWLSDSGSQNPDGLLSVASGPTGLARCEDAGPVLRIQVDKASQIKEALILQNRSVLHTLICGTSSACLSQLDGEADDEDA